MTGSFPVSLTGETYLSIMSRKISKTEAVKIAKRDPSGYRQKLLERLREQKAEVEASLVMIEALGKVAKTEYGQDGAESASYELEYTPGSFRDAIKCIEEMTESETENGNLINVLSQKIALDLREDRQPEF